MYGIGPYLSSHPKLLLRPLQSGIQNPRMILLAIHSVSLGACITYNPSFCLWTRNTCCVPTQPLPPLTLFANTVSVGQGAMSSPEELRGDRGAAVMERL